MSQKKVTPKFQNKKITVPVCSLWEKKKKTKQGLCLGIDLRGLNVVILEYRYPHSLLLLALKQVRGTKSFIKHLHSAHPLIRTQEGDESKTAFINTSGHYGYSWSGKHVFCLPRLCKWDPPRISEFVLNINIMQHSMFQKIVVLNVLFVKLWISSLHK